MYEEVSSSIFSLVYKLLAQNVWIGFQCDVKADQIWTENVRFSLIFVAKCKEEQTEMSKSKWSNSCTMYDLLIVTAIRAYVILQKTAL